MSNILDSSPIVSTVITLRQNLLLTVVRSRSNVDFSQ